MKRFLLALLIFPALVSASDLIVKTGELSVDETIAKIEKIVASKAKDGLGVFTIIDHKKGADKVKLALSETKVILFGNPKLGTKLMQKDPLVALDLPLKVLVYRENNRTKIVYRDPIAWAENFDLKDCKMVDKMVKAMDGITTGASKK
ncbi:MAG: Unknown protein [uncultured Sulfurovum sp.]|uniref:DUF302 domain-containing protein n=1 Tax=uncultured Sulfurovum sp. TaxID=269237 RepID=A0A6S6UC10_9BACT|nr:MAG: Unknown protein [uncultured Sulfurovum sp.]